MPPGKVAFPWFVRTRLLASYLCLRPLLAACLFTKRGAVSVGRPRAVGNNALNLSPNYELLNSPNVWLVVSQVTTAHVCCLTCNHFASVLMWYTTGTPRNENGLVNGLVPRAS